MSEEQLKAFLEKVKGDTSLQEQLKAAASPEAAIAIAKEAGFAITAEDIQSMPMQKLDEHELERVAGGGAGTGHTCDSCIVTTCRYYPCDTYGYDHCK